MTVNNNLTRREIIKGAAACIVVPHIVLPTALGHEGGPSPSNHITLGLIGLGSMGLRHVKGFLEEKDCRIVAVCDVDAARRSEAVRLVNKAYDNKDCSQYHNFRDLIGRKDIDAICISVPDHWHCLTALEAIRAGKDVYGEKPLTLTIAQGRRLVETVNRYGCVWQTGSWQRSTAHFRFGCELVRNKRIGKLLKVEVGIGPGFTPLGSAKTLFNIEPQPVQPVPEGFDYDMWLGPALWAPYTKNRCHWNFRWILDYSGGQVTDWGAHHIDIAHWGMGCDETGPLEVVGKGIFPQDGLWDAAVDYDFECSYADGLVMQVASNNHLHQGVRFIGSDGWVHITRSGLDADPKSLLREKIGPNEIHLARPSGDHRQGHRRDFLDCIKTRARTIAPVEVGHHSAIPAHLGNIAMRLGRKIKWNPDLEQTIGDISASSLLDRAMRSPWHL